MNGIIVAWLYAPNGNPQPGPKFDYKLAWHERLTAHAAGLFATGLPVVLAGDYNIVPEPRDIYPTSSYDDNALVQPQSRAAFQRCSTRAGSTRIRKMHPERDHLHVLGLPAKPLAARRRPAPRPSAAQQETGAPADRRRRRPRGARRCRTPATTRRCG